MLNLRTFFSKTAAFLIKRFLRKEAWIVTGTNAHSHQTSKSDLYYLRGCFTVWKETRMNNRWFFVSLIVSCKYPLTFVLQKPNPIMPTIVNRVALVTPTLLFLSVIVYSIVWTFFANCPKVRKTLGEKWTFYITLKIPRFSKLSEDVTSP